MALFENKPKFINKNDIITISEDILNNIGNVDKKDGKESSKDINKDDINNVIISKEDNITKLKKRNKIYNDVRYISRTDIIWNM